MGLLYGGTGRTGRITDKNGGFRPGQNPATHNVAINSHAHFGDIKHSMMLLAQIATGHPLPALVAELRNHPLVRPFPPPTPRSVQMRPPRWREFPMLWTRVTLDCW